MRVAICFQFLGSMCSQLVGFIRGSRNEFNYVTMLHFLSDYTPVMMKSSSFTVSASFLFWSRTDLIEVFPTIPRA